MFFRTLIPFLLCSLFISSANAAIFSSKNGGLSADDFRNSGIKGFNIGVIADHDDGYYKELKETGANAVRVILPFSRCEQTAQINDKPTDVSQIQSQALEPKCVYKVKKETLTSLNNLLKKAASDNFYVIVVGSFEQNPVGDYWTSKKLQQGISQAWERLAEIYKDNNRIAAFDIFNTPNAAGLNNPAKVQEFWKAGASNIIAHIREIDSKRTVIYQVPYGDALVADKLTPMEDSNVVYGFDMYYPYAITFQGMSKEYPERLTYPLGQEFNLDPFNDGKPRAINADELKLYLSRVAKFSKDNKVPVIISGFGIVHYAPNGSGYRYIQDVAAIFKENGFSWMYEGFRVNQAMDPYIASDDPNAIERSSSAPMISLLTELMTPTKK